MKHISNKTTVVKLVVLCFAAVIAVIVIGLGGFAGNELRVSASAFGPATSFTGAPGEENCTACHTGFPVNSGTGSVTIAGLPANYKAGQQIPITVTSAQSDGVIYGFQLTAIDALGKTVGTFTLPVQNPEQTQAINGIVDGDVRTYISHTIDGILPTQFGSKSWTFNWTAPPQRAGKVGFYAAGNAANSDGNTSGDYIYTTAKATLSGSAIASFEGDQKSDLSVFRPADGVWYSLNSSNGGFVATQFGQNGDLIVPGDYDADGKTDNAVYRPSNGAWYILQSTAGFTAVGFGALGDIPAQGDFDGDLKTDLGVYRPSAGTWFLYQSTAGFAVVPFGTAEDKPVPGDYDADGKTDVAVFRPSSGVWYMLRSTAGFGAIQFGAAEDKPVQSDYDGDGKTDFGVFRPSMGVWFLQNSTAGFWAAQFGQTGDIPCPADFDGDGKTDIAVFRPSQGYWFGLRSTDFSLLFAGFGSNGDIPIPSGYVAR